MRIASSSLDRENVVHSTFTKRQQWRPFIIKPARGRHRNRSHRLTCDGPAPLVSDRDVTCVIDPTPTGAHASTRKARTRLDDGSVDGRNELKGSMEFVLKRRHLRWPLEKLIFIMFNASLATLNL